MFGIGPTEMIIVLVIVLLIFGAKRLPEIGKGLGGAVKEFRSIKKDLSVKDPETSSEKPQEPGEKQSTGSSLETKVADKLLDQIPVAKKAVDVKKKAEKVKEIFRD
jgi:sec-independent protein translocase protein TatA